MSFENFHTVLALLLTSGARPEDCFELAVDPEEAFVMLQDAAGRRQLSLSTGHDLGPVDWKTFDAQLSALARCAGAGLCCLDTGYPEAFHEVHRPPPLLFCTGDISLFQHGGIAVVGTRKPSPGGAAFAGRLAEELAAQGVVVTSGLARGIDSAAHVGALRGGARTVAVIGTGIDVPYPPENADLMCEIGRAGCVVTEQWMGMHADRQVFPRRNRLISALSLAVVVVEGGLRSGALITSRWALEQGRDVGAVPGFPGDFRSAGPNQLLRQGAFVVEGAADVFDAVPRLRPADTVAHLRPDDPGGSDVERGTAIAAVLDAVGSTPCHPDEIAASTGLAIAEVLGAVVELEIAGLLARDDGGAVVRMGK